MKFVPEHMEYKVRQSNSSYLLWLKNLNRYLRLEEPAFRIFRKFAEGAPYQELIADCIQKYQLPEAEAKRFVSEIEEQFRLLYKDYQKPENPSIPLDTLPYPFKIHVEREIEVRAYTVRLSFGDRSLEQFIYPLFHHLEMASGPESCDLHLEIYRYQGKVYLIRNRELGFEWPAAHVFKLKGALILDIVNLIHQREKKSWMGVIHASSVSRGNSSIMFPAQPGGGKSTLAALLMAHGCHLLSDDFTPLAMDSQHILPVPGAISLKQGSLAVLKSYFPGLEAIPGTPNLSKGVDVTFLAPAEPPATKTGGYPVRAIVFVQYDKQAGCELVRRNSLEAINDFLRESWLVDEAPAAEQFMDWYMSTPCYSLRYGDHPKAIKSIQTLFADVT